MIQWQTLRDRVDAISVQLRQELVGCYEGYWSKGQSKPFFSWDVRPGAAATQKQFELLYGAINHIYTILVYRINQLDGDYPEQDMFASYNDDGTVADPIGRVTEARAWLQDVGNQYGVDWAPIRARIVQWAKDTLNRDVALD